MDSNKKRYQDLLEAVGFEFVMNLTPSNSSSGKFLKLRKSYLKARKELREHLEENGFKLD